MPGVRIPGPGPHLEARSGVRSLGARGCGRSGRQCPGHTWPWQGPRFREGWLGSGSARAVPARESHGVPGRAQAARARHVGGAGASRRGRGRGRRAASREAPRGEGPELRAGGLLLTWRRELPARLQEAAGPTPGRRVSFRPSAAAAADPEVRAGC